MTRRGKQTPETARHFATDLPRNLVQRRSRPSPRLAEQPNEKDLVDRLKRFEMFMHLPAPILRRLAGAASIRVYHAGEYLWRQGEKNDRVLFIEQGLAKTARRVREDVNRTYGLYGPGDSMGIYAIWADMKYPTDAVALSDGMTALQVDPGVLVSCAKKEPLLSVPLMGEISRFTEALIHKIEIVSAGTAPQRIATLMLLLVERYGIAVGGGQACLPIYLTLEHVGEIVDARVETVARILSQWKRDGWLSINANGYHFWHFDRIRALLSE
jgi:CRP-like cAMP-binding protein